MDPTMIKAFTRSRVLALSGLTDDQLSRLESAGAVRPSVAPYEPGWPAVYSFPDVLRARLAAELLKRDLTVPGIRRLVDDLGEEGIEDPLVHVRVFGDPDDPHGNGRAFIEHPATGQLLSPHHIGQHVDVYDLKMKDLRSELLGTMQELARRPHGSIERVRGVQGGQPVIVGTRVPARLIGKLASAGWSIERILHSYPHLDESDVRAALEHEHVEVMA